MTNCYSDSYSLTTVMWYHVYIRPLPHGCCRQPVARRLTEDVCYTMFVNMMHAYYGYKFTALLKFTYIMHADLLR